MACPWVKTALGGRAPRKKCPKNQVFYLCNYLYNPLFPLAILLILFFLLPLAVPDVLDVPFLHRRSENCLIGLREAAWVDVGAVHADVNVDGLFGE